MEVCHCVCHISKTSGCLIWHFQFMLVLYPGMCLEKRVFSTYKNNYNENWWSVLVANWKKKEQHQTVKVYFETWKCLHFPMVVFLLYSGVSESMKDKKLFHWSVMDEIALSPWITLFSGYRYVLHFLACSTTDVPVSHCHCLRLQVCTALPGLQHHWCSCLTVSLFSGYRYVLRFLACSTSDVPVSQCHWSQATSMWCVSWRAALLMFLCHCSQVTGVYSVSWFAAPRCSCLTVSLFSGYRYVLRFLACSGVAVNVSEFCCPDSTGMCLTCSVVVGVSEFYQQGCTLQFLLSWAWARVTAIKQQIDLTCEWWNTFFSLCQWCFWAAELLRFH